jgi:hypothetical protein
VGNHTLRYAVASGCAMCHIRTSLEVRAREVPEQPFIHVPYRTGQTMTDQYDRSREVDRIKWVRFYYVWENGACFKPDHDPTLINAASNTTVVLDRMTRRGRLAWYEKQRRPGGTIKPD